MRKRLIISCEHAGNEVPEEYRHLFEDNPEMLNTHRGIDIGALELTNTIAEAMEQKAHLHTVTRLLVDLNRSVQSPTLFSEYTKDQPQDVREHIFKKYYQPHRNRIEQQVEEIIGQGDQAIHLGVHTFTPEWDGEKRDVDIGFLYDPSRQREDQFCRHWRKEVKSRCAELRLKMNEPYRGTMDGLTTYLRRNHPPEGYLGIEIEVSQRFTKPDQEEEWRQLQYEIAESLQHTCENIM